jgi:hypothetical protein
MQRDNTSVISVEQPVSIVSDLFGLIGHFSQSVAVGHSLHLRVGA